MVSAGFTNANPVAYAKKEHRRGRDVDEYAVGANEIFDILFDINHIRDIRDPEQYNYSLEELNVVNEDSMEVDDERSCVSLAFTPILPDSYFAPIIGLCLKVKLMLSLPPHYKVDIRVTPGTHLNEAALNKQLNDKERVAAALCRPQIMDTINNCLAPSFHSTHCTLHALLKYEILKMGRST